MSEVSHQDALVYVMVTMSAVDRRMNDDELSKIGDIIKTLPVFAEFTGDALILASQSCTRILQEEDGLQQVLGIIGSLPEHLHETAYALAVDVAAADLRVEKEEIRYLQMLRDNLGLDKLTIAAIERGAKARHQTL
ncbi:MAG: tellurite resistance TerB family protein [Pseudomonadota bacterium]